MANRRAHASGVSGLDAVDAACDALTQAFLKVLDDGKFDVGSPAAREGVQGITIADLFQRLAENNRRLLFHVDRAPVQRFAARIDARGNDFQVVAVNLRARTRGSVSFRRVELYVFIGRRAHVEQQRHRESRWVRSRRQ